MSLPKIKFLKHSKLFLSILLFLTILSSAAVFAQAQPKTNQSSEYSPTNTPSVAQTENSQNQPTQTPSNTPANNSSQSGVNNPSPLPNQNPNAQFLPAPNKNYQLNQTLPNGQPAISTIGCGLPFTVPVLGGVCNSIKAVIDALGNCGGNSAVGFIQCEVSGAIDVVMRKFLDQATGCGDMDTPNGYADCQQKYLSLLKGGTIADVKNPGALFVLGNVADSGLKLSLPLRSDQYLATINPLQVKIANAQAANELNQGGLNTLWVNMRNTAFALSAVALVVIGFMIMFRARLDPKTSITAMNSLPKVIFALVLIYFSFSLSGLMLDFGRLVLQIVYRTVPLSAGSIGSGILTLIVLLLMYFVSPFLAGAVVSGGGSPHGLAQGLLTVALLPLLLLYAIVILIVIINILFKLVQRYAQFIIYTIFAPFFFLWGALPGQSSMGWFKSQASNVLAIPAMLLFVRLATFIVVNTSGQAASGQAFSLPSPFSSGFSGANGVSDIFWAIISPLVGLGLLFYATKIPAIIDGVMGIKDYGSRAGIGPGIIFAPVSTAASFGKSATGFGNFLNMYAGFGKGQGTEGRGSLPFSGTIGRAGQFIRNTTGGARREGDDGTCLPFYALIRTTEGQVQIQKLRKDMLVWSLNKNGEKIKSKILKLQRVSVGASHLLVRLILKDGRILEVSPTHPTADGRTIVDLIVGDKFDGSIVKTRKFISYKFGYTYDLLVDSDTGFYWANDVLLNTTIKKVATKKEPVDLQEANVPA